MSEGMDGEWVPVLPDADFFSTDVEKAAPAWAHGWAWQEWNQESIHPGQTGFLGQDWPACEIAKRGLAPMQRIPALLGVIKS